MILAVLFFGIAGAQIGLVGWFEEECPDGWESFDELTGRSIIGSGGGNQVGAVGGRSHVSLSSSNIPAHQHKLFKYEDGSTALSEGSACYAGAYANGDYDYIITECGGAANRGLSSIQYGHSGSVSSFDIRDPYLVLVACKLSIDIKNETLSTHTILISNLQASDINQISRLEYLGQSIEANGHSITTNGEAIAANEHSITTNGEAIAANEQSITTNEQSIATHANSLSALQVSDNSQSSTLDTVEDTLDDYERRITSFESLQTTIQTNSDSIQVASTELTVLQNTVSSDHETLTSIGGDVSDNSESIVALESSIQGHDYTAVSSSIAVLDTKVHALENTNVAFASTQDTVDELTETTTSLADSVATIQSDTTSRLAALEASDLSITESLDGLQSNYLVLRERLDTSTDANAALTTSLQGLETRVTQIESVESTIPPANSVVTPENAEDTIIDPSMNDILTIAFVVIIIILSCVVFIMWRDFQRLQKTVDKFVALAAHGGGRLPEGEKRVEMGLYRA